MITAVTEETRPEVLGDRAQGDGAGLVTRVWSASIPTHASALPTAQIAVMGPRARGECSVLQQYPGDRGRRRARRVCRSPDSREYEEDVDSCTSPPSSWSTRSYSPRTLLAGGCRAASCSRPAGVREGFAKRHVRPTRLTPLGHVTSLFTKSW